MSGIRANIVDLCSTPNVYLCLENISRKENLECDSLIKVANDVLKLPGKLVSAKAIGLEAE